MSTVKDFPTVYTVMEISPDGRRHSMGSVCMGNASVDYCIKQGLRWWRIPENVSVNRRAYPDGSVSVTPRLLDPLMKDWTGPVPQYLITEHIRPFHLTGDDDKSLPVMRVDV
jgi:hypothetical protein